MDRPEQHYKMEFASDDWHCPSAENDLRDWWINFKSRMEAKDGSFGFDF
ncbi:MAG: hypothetical protein MZV64_72185 [Ignavibacteriales bacterium]|nr:hypothetical protein [Ignavibacteriales bacterium]